MSLEERELKARKEIEAMELEECVANLEAKRDTMKRRREEQLQCERYDDGEEEGRPNLHVYGSVGTAGMAALSGEEAEPGHSDYKCSRSRCRSRTRQRHRTSAGFGSRSPSSTWRKNTGVSMFHQGTQNMRPKKPNPPEGHQGSPKTAKQHVTGRTRTQVVPGQTTSVTLATRAPSVVAKFTSDIIATKTVVIVSYLILVIIMTYAK